MKQLSIIKFSDVNHKKKDWYDFYKSIKNHKINKAPWKNNFFYFPKAEFSIAWNNYGFFISFFVAENEVLAEKTKINSKVWQDSCVEFFIGFNETGNRHYSFEFNSIGAVYAAINNNSKARKLNRELLKKLIIKTSFKKGKPFHKINYCPWQIFAFIPFCVFMKKDRKYFRDNSEIMINFFKCGDLLNKPHYLCWNNIDYPKPNFHLTEFFGKGILETSTATKKQQVIRK